MYNNLCLLVLSIYCFNKISCGLYNSPYVKELTPHDFKKLVVPSKDIWMVEFYAKWCQFCKVLKPEFLKAARALNGIAKFAAVDAEKYPIFAKYYKVNGYPTLILFGYDKNHPLEYEGEHSADALRSAVFDQYKYDNSFSSL